MHAGETRQRHGARGRDEIWVCGSGRGPMTRRQSCSHSGGRDDGSGLPRRCRCALPLAFRKLLRVAWSSLLSAARSSDGVGKDIRVQCGRHSAREVGSGQLLQAHFAEDFSPVPEGQRAGAPHPGSAAAKRLHINLHCSAGVRGNEGKGNGHARRHGYSP